MFDVLRECGALARLLPEVDRLWGVPQRADYHPEIDTGVHLMMVLDMSARLQARAAGALCLPRRTTWARAPRRPEICPPHRPRAAQRPTAEGRLRAAARAGRLPRAGRRGGARAWQHPPQRRIRRGRAGAAAGTLRRLPQAAALCAILLACECDARGRLGWRRRPIRSGRACWRRWRRRSRSSPTISRCGRSSKAFPARASAR